MPAACLPADCVSGGDEGGRAEADGARERGARVGAGGQRSATSVGTAVGGVTASPTAAVVSTTAALRGWKGGGRHSSKMRHAKVLLAFIKLPHDAGHGSVLAKAMRVLCYTGTGMAPFAMCPSPHGRRRMGCHSSRSPQLARRTSGRYSRHSSRACLQRCRVYRRSCLPRQYRLLKTCGKNNPTCFCTTALSFECSMTSDGKSNATIRPRQD
eukprot:213022-Chlamydomonas_euryale.AAC.5